MRNRELEFVFFRVYESIFYTLLYLFYLSSTDIYLYKAEKNRFINLKFVRNGELEILHYYTFKSAIVTDKLAYKVTYKKLYLRM